MDINTNLVLKNVSIAQKGTFKVIKGKTESVLSRFTDRFDLIFVDPPYGKVDPNEIIKAISDNDLLAMDGVLIYEESIRTPFVYPEDSFTLDSEKRYGDTKIYYLSVK